MSEQLKESMSAVMDSEADAFEMRRVIVEAGDDSEMRARWHRYHLVRDVLRDGGGAVQTDLRAIVWRGLHDDGEAPPATADIEVLPTRPRAPLQRAWLGRVAGFLVAAVVAGVIAYNGGVFDAPVDQSILASTDASDALYPAPTLVDHRRTSGLVLRHVQAQGVNSPSIMRFMKLMTYPQPERDMPMPQSDPDTEQQSPAQ
ncbi:MAG: sigma-E factor negative regulatory protein [Pseudomonadota bacterium]